MPYDPINDIKKVKEYYNQDPLQKRFSALITGETGSGKTFLIRTARMPVHIDSFDPGGTKCLRDLIEKGDIISDTRWENEDPYKPHVYDDWSKETDYRFKVGYFNSFGTYVLDSATSFSDAIMNAQLEGAGRAGETPQFRKDYTPQKTNIVNKIKKFMTLPCDFILLGHLDKVMDTIGRDKYGDPIFKIKYRFMTVGKAVVTVPMQFDELYVLMGRETSKGVERKLIIEAQGDYVARSRLKAAGKLASEEEPDIKKLLRKIGLSCEDKPKLQL